MNEQKGQQDGTSNTRGSTADAQEVAILQRIIQELTPLSAESRLRMIDTVCTFFSVGRPGHSGFVSSPEPSRAHPTAASTFRFSEGANPTPKEFMLTKAPTTDVEKVACLAYYLTHFRATPHFKTREISEVNTEAAQRRFSNAANAVENATKMGYLVPSVKGSKQLSAPGEQFVLALPDREAAREAQDRIKPRKSTRRPRSKSAPASDR